MGPAAPSLAWLKVFHIPRVSPRRFLHRRVPRLSASRRHEGRYQSIKGHPPSLRHHSASDRPAAAMAHARAIGLSDRLVGLNRIFATCYLNRSGGFYRFRDPSLGQNAVKVAFPGNGPGSDEDATAGHARAAPPRNQRSTCPEPRPARDFSHRNKWDAGSNHLPDARKRAPGARCTLAGTGASSWSFQRARTPKPSHVLGIGVDPRTRNRHFIGETRCYIL